MTVLDAIRSRRVVRREALITLALAGATVLGMTTLTGGDDNNAAASPTEPTATVPTPEPSEPEQELPIRLAGHGETWVHPISGWKITCDDESSPDSALYQISSDPEQMPMCASPDEVDDLMEWVNSDG